MRDRELPDPATLTVSKVLLASEGRPFPEAAVELATGFGAPVYVFSIARIWGTSFGFPNPGLLPTTTEWETQRTLVEDAVKRVRSRGVQAGGHVAGTRRGAKRIVAEAERLGCGAIVMGADPKKSRLVSDFMWSQEPHRVLRRARMPVYLVIGED